MGAPPGGIIRYPKFCRAIGFLISSIDAVVDIIYKGDINYRLKTVIGNSKFDLGREDYLRGDTRPSHCPERAAGWDAAHKERWAYNNHVWTQAAIALGWKYSRAYGGYIRADYHPDGPRDQFRSYPSELDAESACFIDGVETIAQAQALIAGKDAQSE